MFLCAPPLFHKAGAAGLTLEYVETSETTSNNGDFSLPSGWASGDLAILLVSATWDTEEGALSGGTPSGWTPLKEQGTSDGTMAGAYARILTGSNTTTGARYGTSSGSNNRRVYAFRPSAEISNLHYPTWGGQTINGSNPSDQTVTLNPDHLPLVVIGAVTGYLSSPDIASSPSFDAAISSGILRPGYRIVADSPASHTISVSGGSGRRTLISGYVGVS